MLPKPSMKACAVSRTDMMSLTATRGLSARPRPRKVSASHLLRIADDAIDLGHGGETLGLDLGGAARDDQARFGALAPQLADGLGGLSHRLGGDGAGVDDHRVLEPGRRRVARITSDS